MASFRRSRSPSGGLLAALLWALLSCCASKVKESSRQLDNGLRVDLVASPRGEKVAVLLAFDVGLDHDPPGRSGMANLVSRLLLTAATPGKAARTREELTRQYGSSWLAQSGRDFTVVGVSVPRQELAAELVDFAARMEALKIGEPDLARERPALLAELAQMRGGDPAQAAMSFAAEAIRPSRGGWSGGVPKEIEAAGADEVAAYWKQCYRAGNARLVVVGRGDLGPMVAQVETAFGKVAAGSPPVLRPPNDSKVAGTLVMGDAPSAVALAVSAPSPAEPLFPAFLVLSARLQAAGAIHANYAPLEQPDVLFVTGKVEPPERPDDAAARLRKAVAALLAAGPGPNELSSAAAAFGPTLGTELRGAAAYEKDPLGAALSRARAAQLRIDGPALAKSLAAVTASQLAEAAKRFEPTQTAAVAAGGAIPSPQ